MQARNKTKIENLESEVSKLQDDFIVLQDKQTQLEQQFDVIAKQEVDQLYPVSNEIQLDVVDQIKIEKTTEFIQQLEDKTPIVKSEAKKQTQQTDYTQLVSNIGFAEQE